MYQTVLPPSRGLADASRYAGRILVCFFSRPGYLSHHPVGSPGFYRSGGAASTGGGGFFRTFLQPAQESGCPALLFGMLCFHLLKITLYYERVNPEYEMKSAPQAYPAEPISFGGDNWHQ